MTTYAPNHPAVRAAARAGAPLRRRLAASAPPLTSAGARTFGTLAVLVISLCFLGTVMVLSSSSVAATDKFGSTWGYFERQVMWLAIGLVALYVTQRIDYHLWRRLRVPLMAVTLAGLVAVMIPGVGRTINGSSRWIGVGPLTIQPSELAKLALIVWVADLLARRAGRVTDPHATLYPALTALAVIGGLVLLEPDLGTTVILGSLVMAMLWVHGAPLRWMAALTASGVLATLALGMSAGYRRARLLAFLDPWADAQNTGYQTVQSLLGLGAGGITGLGLGASRAKWGFLPNAHTDFIYAIIGEELGLIGALAVLVAFVALGFVGIRAAALAPDRFGMLVATGLVTWILVQAFVNMGAVIGVLPVTGVPLPFVSFGGTSLVVTLAATGVLLNIARQGRESSPAEPNAE